MLTGHAVLTFAGTWANVAISGNAMSYFKGPDGFVHLRGEIKSGACGTTVFTLPSGYRPKAKNAYALYADAGSAPATAGVATTGVVTVFCTLSTSIALDGITFDTR